MGSEVVFRGLYPTSMGLAKGLELPNQRTVGTALNNLIQSQMVPLSECVNLLKWIVFKLNRASGEIPACDLQCGDAVAEPTKLAHQ